MARNLHIIQVMKQARGPKKEKGEKVSEHKSHYSPSPFSLGGPNDLHSVIEEKILSIARLYNEVSTSDLQGIVSVEASKIIELVRKSEEGYSK